MTSPLLRAKVILITILLIAISNASVSVKIFSRNEAMSESNISKIRIFIQNTGTETINDFSYRFYFSTENGMFPSVQDYYTPNEHIILGPTENGYYIQYNVTGANILPGGLHPHSSGNCVGLHYNDWSTWDKTNDFSDNLSSSFTENQNISFYYNGTKIYGNDQNVVSGSVLREMWTNISGISTDDIPLSTNPQITGFQYNLDAAYNFSNNYGIRIRGYITAPVTGDYTFWIASDDCSKLYLSSNEDTANKGTPIASVTGYTAWKQWDKYTSQKSSPVSLVAGNRYYIEILHKDGEQDDNCSVGWLKPGENGTVPSEIVPSSVLTPYIPAVLPATPANLTATTLSSHRINLSWTDASYNELGFKLEMKQDGGIFSEFAMITSNQTSYQVTGLSPEKTYHFRIRSYNVTGSSGYSDSVSATTFALPAGTLTREVWTDVSGTLVSNIPVSTSANIVDAINLFETPQQWSNYYGQRIRGYIIPPATGTYYFWIASDDNSQLWLSSNSEPSSKVMIASLSGYTNYHEWNKYSTQKSGPVNLTAGVRYYIEVLHKEGNQDDNLSVGWLKPGQSGSQPSEV
ncbi:MAG TPA: PA14 domain-containing protein, partial [Chitinispirillaceae bacterium]|nr:PA14 domain-containing protein [Chitinispirillaceae bacterium]